MAYHRTHESGCFASTAELSTCCMTSPTTCVVSCAGRENGFGVAGAVRHGRSQTSRSRGIGGYNRVCGIRSVRERRQRPPSQKRTGYYNENAQTNRVDLTLPALEALGDHLARFPGRKSVVWVGNGMPLFLGGSRARKERDFEPRMRQTAQRLATQGVAVYPVAQPSNMLTPETVREALNLFADTTGGRVTLTMNDPTEGLRTTALDQRAIYAIGFYAVAPPDNKWHPITVQVRRPNVVVTHRQGYLAEAPAIQPLEWAEEQWRSALANPLGSSVVRLDAQVESPAGAPPRTLDLRVQIGLDDLHFRDAAGKSVADIEIATAEKLASGDFAFRVERATLGRANVAPGAVAPYSRRWTLRPETTIVRIIVRDRFTGRYGTLEISVQDR